MDKDSIDFINALKDNDIDLMKKVPKADVHNHAGLGGNFDKWTKKEKLNIKKDNTTFTDFSDFQDLVDKIYSYPYSKPTNIQQRERFLSLYLATYDFALEDGVTYIEPGYDSYVLGLYDMDIEKMILQLSEQTEQYSDKISISPDVGIIRVFDKKEIEKTTYPCIESGFFKSLDIFADERIGPPEDFKDIFKAAKNAGMKLKAHAGELLDAEYVRRSVEVLDLDEVQHGIAAAKSPEVMKFLVDRGTRLNICPSSNIQLCQVDSYKTHPVRILIDNGVKVTINSDDAIIFGQSVSDEFFSLYKTGLYSAEELNEVRLNGFPKN